MTQNEPNYNIPNCFYVALFDGRVFILFFDDFFGADELENECLVYSTSLEDFLENIAEDAMAGSNEWVYDLDLDRLMLNGEKPAPHMYWLFEKLVLDGVFKPISREIVDGWKER